MRKLVAKINCPECARALVIDTNDTNEKDMVHDHYHSNSHAPSSLSLIRLKNRGGLILPSASVVKVIFVSERAFKVAACKTRSKQKAVSSKGLFTRARVGSNPPQRVSPSPVKSLQTFTRTQ